MKVVFMGSAKIDLEAWLPGDFPTAHDTYALAPTAVSFGGTCGGFATAAFGHLDELHVITALGQDEWTPTLRRHLENQTTAAHIEYFDDCPNATVLIVRSRDGAAGDSLRLLVASPDSPHKLLTSDHVLGAQEMIANADVLIADTYFLQGSHSARALRTALEIATSVGTTSVLDLLPHTLPETHTLDDLYPYIEAASVVVCEARTLVGLATAQWPVTLEDAALIVEAKRVAEGLDPTKSWIVRHGNNHIENNSVRVADSDWVDYCSLYRHASQKRGFGDRLLLFELAAVLSVC